MNKEQLIQLAKRTVNARRQSAINKCENNLAKLRSHEDFASCEHDLKAAQVRLVFASDKDAAKEISDKKALLEKLLVKYNMKNDDLVPHFFCEKCQDTGYVDGKTCVCLQKELRNLLVSQGNANADYTFGKSTEKNKHNLAVYKKAQQVCAEDGTNMLLVGNTGCGKTFLLSACANLCANRDKSVLFVTAYNLSSLFLEAHLSDLATKQLILDNLTDADVLCIDDLGTENVYQNVTAQYLFALVNERIAAGRQTFFSTNLSLSELRERYDERIFSRLVDQKITFVAKLEGNDKRVTK